MRPVATYRIRAATPGWLTLVRGGIVAVDDHDGDRRAAPSVDLIRNGSRRPVAIFTGEPGNVIEGVVATRDYVAWTVESEMQDNGMQPVSWTIYAYSMRAGRVQVVARSPAPSVESPWPAMEGHRIAWDDSDPAKTTSADIHLKDLDTGIGHRVLSGVPAGQILLRPHTLIYNGSVKGPAGRSMVASDLFEFDLRSGRTRRLTHVGSVDVPAIWGRWLAWEAGSSDPGQKLGWVRLPDGPVLTLKDRLQGVLRVGPGFAVYDAIGGLDATALAPGAKPVRIVSDARESCAVCGFSVRGNRVAWGATHHGTTTVTVDAINLSSPGGVGGVAPSASEPTIPGGP